MVSGAVRVQAGGRLTVAGLSLAIVTAVATVQMWFRVAVEALLDCHSLGFSPPAVSSLEQVAARCFH